jgi:hypothetical protein
MKQAVDPGSSGNTNQFTFDFTQRRQFKISLATVCGLFSVLILIIFQPFGINNYQHEFSITWQWLFLVSMFGVIGFAAIMLNEFFIRPVVLKSVRLIPLIVWFAWEFILVGLCNFLYYNYLGGFNDMSISSLLILIMNTSLVLIIPFLGTLFYFRFKQLKSDYVEILTLSREKSDSNDIVLISGDYKKDKIGLAPDRIICIKSADNYVALNYREGNETKRHLIRSTLSNMEKRIDHQSLHRCNRSYIVNLDKIASFIKKESKIHIKLTGYPDEIEVSKKYAPIVNDFLEANFTSSH